MSRIQVLLPVPERKGTGESPLARRLPTLNGKTVGLITNRWRSLDIMYALFQEELKSQYGVKGFVLKEATTTGPVTSRDFEDIVSQADAVITGLAN